MCFNYRKAKRIMDSTKSRTNFANTYGDAMAKILANWYGQLNLTRTEASFLFRCVDDYDEVLAKSKGRLPTSPQRKKTTIAQLALELFK